MQCGCVGGVCGDVGVGCGGGGRGFGGVSEEKEAEVGVRMCGVVGWGGCGGVVGVRKGKGGN